MMPPMHPEPQPDFDAYARRHGQIHVAEAPPALVRLCRRDGWRTFLDVGCGEGSLLAGLRRLGLLEGKRVLGVDVAAARLAEARKVDASFDLRQDSACELATIGSGSIDLLASTQVIEHVPDDRAMLAQVARVLAPGGRAYLSTVLRRPWAWYFYRCNGRWVLDPTHVREYTDPRQLLGPARALGLEAEFSGMSRLSFPLIDPLLRRLGWAGAPRRRRALRLLRGVRVPIPGYRCWEMVLRRDADR